MTLDYYLMFLSGLWLGFEITVIGLKHSKSTDKKYDHSSLRIMWLAIALAIGGGITMGVEPGGRIAEDAAVLRVSGIVLIIFGILLRWAAIQSLKERFTVDVAITAGHRIVTYGIYGHIRHPAYAGSLLSFIGLGVYFANFYSLLIICLPILAAFLYRIKVEEAALRDTFGEEYVTYAHRTKRLIPGIF
jgi:protein-S-isoprenylcysteine O-methyltransferase Ste14